MTKAMSKVIQRKKRRSGRDGFLLSVVMRLPSMDNELGGSFLICDFVKCLCVEKPQSAM